MKTSESVVEISKALASAWGTMGNPKHNKKVNVKMKSGGQYNFEYTDLGGIIDSVKPHFKEHGISIMNPVSSDFVEGRIYVFVRTRLTHSSGEWMLSDPLIVSSSNTIQDMGGQLTYLRRYSTSAMLGISTEEDDDVNGSMGNQVNYQSKEPKKEPKQVDVGVVKAKFIGGGGTEEQFKKWHDEQVAAGYNHNQMDVYLTKRLADRDA